MAKLTALPTTGALMPIGLFVWLGEHGLLHDRRGFGLAVTGREVDPGTLVLPSMRHGLPPAATHVLWFDASVPLPGC
jgi:hypothetical protein